MGKALKTVGMVIGAAALIATGAGALLMPGLAGSVTLFGVSAGTLNMVSAGLTAVGGLLEKPQSIGSGSPTDWTSNPDQPVPFAFGRVGVAGKIVHRDEFGSDNFRQGIISIYSGAGPIRSFQTYKAGDLTVNFTGAGAALGKYAGQMWRVTRLGMQPDTALSVVLPGGAGQQLPQWGSSHKLSGKACDLLVLQQDSKFSVYPTGEPTPLAVLEGIYGYDPRFDDTYPGGAGTCRLGVRSTYRWIDNPIIAALNWALGLVENGQVVGGVGASIDGIDVPAFVEAANIADANDWKVTAWPDTSEDVSQVLKQFLQAGGASYARHAGKISCVSRGAARASIVTITGRDTCGPLELDTGSSSFNRLNTITPEFMSEAHGWKKVPADPVTFAALRTEDGGKKSDSIEYRFVPAVKQAAQLAAYDILDAREPFSGTIPLKPHLRRLKRGDCFVIDEPGFLLDGVKCMVLSRTYQPQTGEVRIAFRSETDGKHDLALGKTTTMPEYPALTPADPTLVTPPAPGDIVVTPRPPAGGGVQVPGFDLTIDVTNSTATAVLVEWWEVPDGVNPALAPPVDAVWQSAGTWPPTVTTVPINVQPSRWYWIGLTNVRGENYSTRTVDGPKQAPGLTAEDVVAVNGVPVAELTGRLTDAETLVNATKAQVDALETTVASAESDFGQALILVGQQVEAAEDAASAANGSATTASSAAGEALAYRNQASAARDDAVTARDEAQTAATTSTGAAATAVSASSSAGASASEAALSAQLAAKIGGGSLNPNPTFAAWTGALPDSWTRHGTVGASTITKVAGLNGSPNALRQASNLTSECGLRTDVSPSAGGEYAVIEADFTLVSGSLVGAGILCQTLNSGGASAGNTFSQAFATVKDASGTVRGAGVAGQTYRYRLLANLKAATVATYRLYGMTRYSPGAWGPADGAATLDWHRLAVRAATPEEIAAGTVLPGVVAELAITAKTTAGSTGQVLLDVTGGAGGDPFNIELKAGPGASSASMTATEISLRNVVADQVIEALTIKGGNAALAGNLTAGSGIFLGTGTVWAVALRPQAFVRGDGETISFGGANIGIPTYEFVEDNLLPLAAGEKYDLRLTGLTAAGATVYAKINVPGSSGSQSVAATSTPSGSGPTFQLLRGALTESASGLYSLTASGKTTVRVLAGAFELERGGTAVVDIFVRKSGVWSRAGSIEASWFQTFTNTGPTYNADIFWTANGALQLGAGVEGWGATLVSHGGFTGDTGALTGFGPVSWSTSGTPSGVRSALAAGAKTTIRITPQG